MSAPDLCRGATARAVARRFRVGPQHHLGQNFLVDQEVRDAIVATLDPGLPVLEIGCGLGALSQGLLRQGFQLTGVEIDSNCVAALRLLQADHPEFRVVEADALRVAPDELGVTEPYQVVANLPYQITGAILPRLMEWTPPPVACHLLVQREVAQRLTAGLGDWSLATLGLRLVATVGLDFDVEPVSFWPQPKVRSSLIHLRPRSDGHPERLGELMRLAQPMFQMRRKQIHHGLARALGVDSARATELLRGAGIDPSRRPGSLGVEEWLTLLRELGAPPPG